MTSEWARKKAEALLAGSFVEHTEECQHAMWNEPGCTCGREELRDEIAAALDAARAEGVAEGEERAAATIRENVMTAKQAAERERWECHQIASDFADRFGGTAGAVAIRIAARGPMRGPEGCSDGCGAASDEHCWNSSDWADGATPMRGPEEEK